MKTHVTGIGMRDRRAKGKNSKPMIRLLIEVFMLTLAVFFVSLAGVQILTGASVFGAIFFFVLSCLPRYKKVRARQTEKHTHNNIHTK
jgi:uncharacterized membrane protein